MMSTKSANGGALICIRETMNSKLRPDLTVGKEKELESIFIEILQKSIQNVIIGCIYRHPFMHLKEFNDLFLKSFTERLAREKKEVILLGNFKIGPIESTK